MSVASDFWSSVLRDLGAPVTQNNINVLEAWSSAEGTKANWNPLATTQGQGSNFNSVGVKNFADAVTGEQATAATLVNGRYDAIVQGLRNNLPLSAYMGGSPAISADLRTWSGGGYGSIPNHPGYVSPAFGSQITGNPSAGPLFGGSTGASPSSASASSGGCQSLGQMVQGGIPGLSGVAGFFGWIAQPCVYWRLLIWLVSGALIIYGLKLMGQPEPANIVTAPFRAVERAA